MKLIYLLLLFPLIACSKDLSTPPETDLTCDAPLSQDDSRDDVLLIGDSISIGYTPFVQNSLPSLDVQRNPCNARGSENGKLNIDRWLARRPHWKLITFNHGIWDTVIAYNVSLEEYRSNLIEVATKIKSASDHAIFFTTTRIPKNNTICQVGKEDELNAVAIQVMSDLNIPVVDLNALSHEIAHLYQSHAFDADVHLTNEGYEILASKVTEAIELTLSP